MDYSNFEYGTKEHRLWYTREKNVVPRYIYSSQKQSSKKRGHKPPAYSVEWLIDWMMSNPEYDYLYSRWVDSGYDRDLKPTVNRIDDEIGYMKYNIELMDWKTNRAEGHKERAKSNQCTAHGKLSRVVQQFENFELINEYKSLAFASRETGISRKNIQSVCAGRRRFAGGYMWEYKDENFSNIK